MELLKDFLLYLKANYYELKSRFVAQKVAYKVEGECKKCGQCCRYMYSIDTYSEKEFLFMQKLFPKYKRFKIVGKDEQGNLIFACTLVDEDGLCIDYENRLAMCKYYPGKKIYFHGKLHDGCGYQVVPAKKFENYIKQ